MEDMKKENKAHILSLIIILIGFMIDWIVGLLALGVWIISLISYYLAKHSDKLLYGKARK